MSFIETLGINFALQAIHAAIKNPAHAAALKSRFIEIRDAINALYPGE